jgi:hypothetical protein
MQHQNSARIGFSSYTSILQSNIYKLQNTKGTPTHINCFRNLDRICPIYSQEWKNMETETPYFSAVTSSSTGLGGFQAS